MSVVEYGGKTDTYEWTQTKDEVTVTLKVPANLKARDFVSKMERKALEFGVKGQAPLVKGTLPKTIKVAESTWTKEGDTVEISLSKEKLQNVADPDKEEWWDCLVEEDKDKEGGAIDAELIEASKYLDEGLLKQVKAKKLEQKAAAAAAAAGEKASSP
jgi:hypothetical protein